MRFENTQQKYHIMLGRSQHADYHNFRFCEFEQQIQNYFRNIFFSRFERYRVTVPLVGKGCRRLVDIMYSWNFKNRLVLDEAYKPLPVNRHVKAITILDSE